MNQVNVIGNLTADVEFKVTQSGVEVANGTIAVRRSYKNAQGEYETDFIRFIAFKKTAEFLAQYTAKGHKVGLNGSWQTGSYDAQDGSKRYTNDLVVNNITLLESKNNNQSSNKPKVDISDLPF